MDRIRRSLLVPVLAVAGLFATPRIPGQEPPVAPSEQYQALLREFNQTARLLWEATTDEQRSTAAARMAALSTRTLDWAEHNAGDPMAQDSLVQVVVQEIWLQNNTAHPGRGGESLEDRAIALLLQHHVRSEGLGAACTRMSYGFGKGCETFLRAVLASSPHRDVQGLACLRLAQFLNGRLRRLDLLSVHPAMLTRYEGLFGKDQVAQLLRLDRTTAMKEIETLFERAASEFGDTKLPYDRTAGEMARSELHEIRHLSIGCEAPELAGQDQDGKPIALSDYRGKVVLLYFWSEY